MVGLLWVYCFCFFDVENCNLRFVEFIELVAGIVELWFGVGLFFI